jgi:tetratricopeptide (TPR) repeat protein
MPAGSSAAVRARYAELRAAGVASIRKGDYPAALRDFQAAFELASTSGRVQLRHEAQANLAMTYIQLGQDRTAEQGLRQILLETPGARLRFGAAYNLAVSLRKQGRYSRARFYARQAMESARRLGDASRRAACHNLLGNILMNQSFLSEALFEYRQALAIRRRQRRDVRFSTAIVLENIGYTYLLLR